MAHVSAIDSTRLSMVMYEGVVQTARAGGSEWKHNSCDRMVRDGSTERVGRKLVLGDK